MRPARISSKGSPLRRAAGGVLIVGLQGATLSSVEVAWLELIRPSGIILFRRNIESARQTHALLTAAQNAAGRPLLRCVDVEGGTVDRLRDLIAPMPSPRAVGNTRSTRLFAAHGALIGKELRLLGFNVTLAPVLDLRTEASEGVLTSRVVSSDPGEIILYARHFLAGLAKQRILGCGKHFPGLGSGETDSHFSTPRIRRSFESLWQEDLLPYRTLAAQLPFVMISHAGYPLTSSATEPASISSFWTTTILKKKIGFRGLILSDDMEMGGILSYADIGEAAIRAVLAGTHRVELCHDPARVLATYEALLSEAEQSPAFSRRLIAAASAALAPTQQMRERLPPAPAERSVTKIRDEIRRFAETVSRQAERTDAGRGPTGDPAR